MGTGRLCRYQDPCGLALQVCIVKWENICTTMIYRPNHYLAQHHSPLHQCMCGLNLLSLYGVQRSKAHPLSNAPHLVLTIIENLDRVERDVLHDGGFSINDVAMAL